LRSTWARKANTMISNEESELIDPKCAGSKQNRPEFSVNAAAGVDTESGIRGYVLAK
jgi:hypothetical protein